MEENIPKAAPRRRNIPVPSANTFTTIEETRSQSFYRLHTEACQSIARGQELDGAGNRDFAMNEYLKALHLIDKIIQFAYQEGFSADEVSNIDEKVIKMKLIRKDILERFSDLQHSTAQTSQSQSYLEGPTTFTPSSSSTYQSGPAYNDDPYCRPPPYNEAMDIPQETHGPFSGNERPYGHLNTALEEMAARQGKQRNPERMSAQQVFGIANNVQIHFKNSYENASAPIPPSFLRVVVLHPAPDNGVPAFIQVGDWTYPLIPNRSQISKSAEGTYIFQDLSTSAPGSSVELGLPSDLSPDLQQTFENILLQLTGLPHLSESSHNERTTPENLASGMSLKRSKKGPERPPPPQVAPETEPSPVSDKRMSVKITAGLITGAEAISKGLTYGALKTSQFLEKGTTYLQSKVDPIEEPKAENNSLVATSSKKPKTISGKAAQVSGFLVNQFEQAMANRKAETAKEKKSKIEKSKEELKVKDQNASQKNVNKSKKI